jgi:hypothetical protein
MSENFENTSAESAAEVTKPKVRKGFLATIFGGDLLTGNFVQKHLGLIGFIGLLLILDIALQYKFEDYQKQIQRNNKALNEQRTIYNESMSALEIKKRQSQVAQDIAKMGLKELSSPPIILESTDTLQEP